MEDSVLLLSIDELRRLRYIIAILNISSLFGYRREM